MRKLPVSDGADSFEVALFEAAAPSAVVLFAVGGGGSPERHLFRGIVCRGIHGREGRVFGKVRLLFALL